MNKNQKFTPEEIEALRAEVYQSFKETNQEIRETRRELKEQSKESRREAKESRQESRRVLNETSQKIKELANLVGGISNSNGEMAEEYFYNAFFRDRSFVNEHFDKIRKNLSYNNGIIGAEFDIVLFNGKSAAIIEVKYHAKPEHIEIEKLISRVEVFKILFPEYTNHKIYLGVAAMAFKRGLAKELHQAGIATIRAVGKKMVVYDKSVKAF